MPWATVSRSEGRTCEGEIRREGEKGRSSFTMRGPLCERLIIFMHYHS